MAGSKGIGGSDAGAILGLDPYRSVFAVYCDKLGLLPEQPDNEAMRQGRDLENYVALRFEEQTGLRVRRCGYMLQHPKISWALANVDRLIVGKHAGLECKTTSVLTRTKYDRGDIPAQYYAQCMHYIAVTGLPVWYLAVLVLNKAFYVFTVERDEAEVKSLLEAERDFWEGHVLPQVPPEPDGSAQAGKVIAQLHPAAEAGSDEPLALYEESDRIARYLDLDGQIKQLTAVRDGIKQRLQLRLGDSLEGRTDRYVVRWPNAASTRLDTRRLKAERPEIYKEYAKTVSYRKFEIKEIQAS